MSIEGGTKIARFLNKDADTYEIKRQEAAGRSYLKLLAKGHTLKEKQEQRLKNLIDGQNRMHTKKINDI